MTRTDAMGHRYTAQADGTIAVSAYGTCPPITLTADEAREVWAESATLAASYRTDAGAWLADRAWV